MKRTGLASTLALGGLLACGAAAQEVDSELTMTMIPETAGELPDVVTRELELPDAAAEEGVLNSDEGLATANENRAEAAENRAEALERAAERREAGLATAADARERGAEMGSEIAEAAAAGRESLVRGDADLDLPIPDHLPELPDRASDRTEVPELPERPGPDNVPAP